MAIDTVKTSKFAKEAVLASGGIVSSVKPMLMTDNIIKQKFEALGGSGALGEPTNKIAGKIWSFSGCSIVYNTHRKAAFQVKGAIHEKWIRLGGMDWGVPNTDELPAVDGTGRFNHFNEDTASIFWHPSVGASGVWGDIRKKWTELGWERGYLGYPTSDEEDIGEGGRANSFQNGQIYWWPDMGAIDLRGIVIHYTGFYARKESDWDQSSGSDEPYAIFSIVAPKVVPYTLRTQTYSSVDDNSARPDLLELYRGPAWGVGIMVTAMERDFGDPEANRAKVQAAVIANHEIGKFALEHIPLVGPALAKLAAELLDDVMPDIGNAVAGVLNLGDDTVGKNNFSLKTRQLVMLATRTENSVFKGIGYKIQSNMMKGGGAEYRVYLGVVPA